jgi:hypothetical protein
LNYTPFQENSMFQNNKLSEALVVVANIAPVSQGVGSVSTAYVPVKNYHQLAAVINTGVLGSSATVDAKFEQAQDVSGTGVKDITGKAVTQIVKATGDGKQAFINLRPLEMDTNGGFTHVRLTVTVGTAASLVAAELLAMPRYEPANTMNQATVVQVV